MKILSKIDRLYKLASVNSKELLAQALATGDKSMYQVFLDKLEEEDAEAKEKLIKEKDLHKICKQLSNIAPEVMTIDTTGNVIFYMPIFTNFHILYLGLIATIIGYNDFEVLIGRKHSIKKSSVRFFDGHQPSLHRRNIEYIIHYVDDTLDILYDAGSGDDNVKGPDREFALSLINKYIDTANRDFDNFRKLFS
jgi:hypothetical protein